MRGLDRNITGLESLLNESHTKGLRFYGFDDVGYEYQERVLRQHFQLKGRLKKAWSRRYF